MDPYKGGQILGDSLFGRGEEGAYEKQLRRVGEAESAIQQARRDRSLALIDAARQDARGRINADLLGRAMAGDLGAQSELGASVLGSNATIDLGQIGDFARPFYGQNTNAAQEALTLGDIPTYNKMTAAAAGKDYQPVRELGGAYIADGATLGDLDDMVPTLGTQSRMATDRAQQANSYANAARTRQAMGIDAAKFGMERAGQWNPGSRSGSAGGGRGAAGPGKLTEQQSKDLVYFTRGSEANKALEGLANNLTLTGGEQGAWGVKDQIVRNLPFGLGESAGANVLVSSERQQAEQAAREFLSAILRKDTGAAITEQEIDIYGKTYLPQPGDSTATLNQKAKARETALRAIEAGLGPARAAVPVLGDDEPAPQPTISAPAAGGRRRYNRATGRIE